MAKLSESEQAAIAAAEVGVTQVPPGKGAGKAARARPVLAAPAQAEAALDAKIEAEHGPGERDVWQETRRRARACGLTTAEYLDRAAAFVVEQAGRTDGRDEAARAQRQARAERDAEAEDRRRKYGIDAPYEALRRERLFDVPALWDEETAAGAKTLIAVSSHPLARLYFDPKSPVDERCVRAAVRYAEAADAYFGWQGRAVGMRFDDTPRGRGDGDLGMQAAAIYRTAERYMTQPERRMLDGVMRYGETNVAAVAAAAWPSRWAAKAQLAGAGVAALEGVTARLALLFGFAHDLRRGGQSDGRRV